MNGNLKVSAQSDGGRGGGGELVKKQKKINLNYIKAIQLKFFMVKLLYLKFHKISMLV